MTSLDLTVCRLAGTDDRLVTASWPDGREITWRASASDLTPWETRGGFSGDELAEARAAATRYLRTL